MFVKAGSTMIVFATLLALVTGLSVTPARAQPAPPAATSGAEPARTDPRLVRIMEDYAVFRAGVEPDYAARRDGRAPDRWPDVTPEAVEAARFAREGFIDRLTLLGPLEGRDGLDRDVLIAILREDMVPAQFDLARIPFTGDWGFQLEPAFAAPQTRLGDIATAEAWIRRLNDVPRYFAEQIANMRRGIDTGFTAHSDPVQTTLDQIGEQIVDDPTTSALYAPFLTLPDTIPPGERVRLRADGASAVMNAIAAYRDLQDFLEYEYLPQARPQTGLSSLPDGAEAYRALLAVHTTRSDLTPEEVHEIGRKEVARIRAEMEAIIAEIGFEGDFAAFLEYLRTDPQFYARTPEQLMQRAERVSERLRLMLPKYFETLPVTPFTVAPVPASIAPGFTTARYMQGNAQEGQPGTYLVNTYRLDQRPLYELPALSAHEAVPGHHLQIALAQEMRGAPDFRRDYYATAFGEGWALYAETLAGEAGIYRTPYERFGALSYQMWRACRLVADTGIHWYNWTREEAEACFLENTALSPLNVRNEVTRYIGWPGQATAYMTGQLTLLDLRGKAKAALGEDFDIKAFHTAVLGAGSLPLDVLETRIEGWIAAQLALRTPGSVP